MNRVVLAVNDHPDFKFLVPITARVWAARTGYRPTILTTSHIEELSPTKHDGIWDVHEVDCRRDRLYIKLCRWYSWMVCHKEDVLLLTDIDHWPIDGAFWNQDTGRPVTMFYGDAFQGRMHTTLGFRAKAFALQEITEGGDPDSRIAQIRQRPDDWDGRHSDDCAQSELVMKWAGYPSLCHMIERGPSPPKTRIDRSAWPEKFDLTGKVDAHLPRDASDGRVWRKILPLFDLLCPDQSAWVREYRKRWEEEWL